MNALTRRAMNIRTEDRYKRNISVNLGQEGG